MSRVYDEIIDLMARSTGPRDITSFEPSEASKERVYALIHKEKEASLTPQEKQELDDYMRLEHLMRMVKARARDCTYPMSSYVPAALRRQVVERAGGICEYCLLHESDGYHSFEVEHVIAEKHGGATSAENLAYACLTCNRCKGTDIASISPRDGTLSRLFNPRLDYWGAHFAVNGAWIEPLTIVGEVTVRVLSLNNADRTAERELLIAANRYPPPEADHLTARS